MSERCDDKQRIVCVTLELTETRRCHTEAQVFMALQSIAGDETLHNRSTTLLAAIGTTQYRHSTDDHRFRLTGRSGSAPTQQIRP